jgi:2,5-dihydroxypyridine 5,6-dioxygenase
MPKQHAPTAAAVDLISIFRDALAASAVKKNETVIIMADTFSDQTVCHAFLGAAKQLAGHVVLLIEPIIETERARVENRAVPSKVVLSALRQADLVVDVSSGGLLYSDLRAEILAAGTRILRIREPIETLRRLPVDPIIRRRGLAGAEAMSASQVIRVSTDSGTNFTVSRGNRVVSCQYGAADTPGRWDHWPTGMVYCSPVEHSLEGRLVIDPGSLMFPPDRYVMEPIVCEFENGRMARIEGGVDAMLLREYLGRSGNPNAYRLAHLGWGTDHRARWEAFSMWGSEGGGGAESRSIIGGVLMAFGDNIDIGGENAAPVHVDICLRQARLELDGMTVVDTGKIVSEALA